MPTTWLPDEVWAQLDPRQARLSKRGRRSLLLLIAVVSCGTVLIALGVASGELGGSLYVPTWSTRIDTQTHEFVETISIKNEGWFDETITSASVSRPHVAVTAIRPLRLTIPHDHTRTLTLQFHVTDCAAVAAGDYEPVVHLERFWGTQSVTLQILDWTAGLQPGSLPLDNGPAWAACDRGN